MKFPSTHTSRGSVLVIVLWICFGLVALALYFAHSSGMELRAADNREAGAEAEQAIMGALRYAKRVISSVDTPGKFPDYQNYKAEDVAVGDASFWFIGRSDRQNTPDLPAWGLVDEAGKINLNTATQAMLELLPNMTPEIAAAIIDWRDSDSNPGLSGTNANAATTVRGAEDEVYGRLTPARKTKNAKFETVEELRLVYGTDSQILFGEDANLNGVLDPNENDGTVSAPYDNHDGKLDPGLLEYVTVYSRESNLRTNGQQRINVTGQQAVQQIASVLSSALGSQRANQIIAALGRTPTFRSVMDFYLRSGMTAEEFALVEGDLTASNGAYVEGRVNVNSASEAVLTCIPGISNNASALIAYRQQNPDKLTSIAWVAEAIDRNAALTAGPYITARTFQFSVDVAAIGHHGRGYQRVKFIVDNADGTPKVIFRRDLSHLGWALGRQTRENIQLSLDSRP